MRTEPSPSTTESSIIYSHYAHRQVAAEQCVALHSLSYILAGSLRVTEAGQSQTFGAGSLLFVRKNFLAKFIKQPAVDGPFRSVTVVFDQAMLLAAYQPAGRKEKQPAGGGTAVQLLAPDGPLRGLCESLQLHFEQPLPAPLARLKQQEALRLLLQAHPDLQAVLFDFGQPGKIDLEVFMRQNFRFNIELKQLAYLTGRSLATFKRDFARIFHASPARWLLQKRLAEAHYLLQEERKRPSDVYYDVGFESLAHFSAAFKQAFGCPPSHLLSSTSSR